MKHRCIVLSCVALLGAGCNELLGFDADFTVSDSHGGGGAGAAGVGGEAEGGQPPSSGGSPSTAGGGQGAEGGMGGGSPLEATCEEYCDTINTHCTNANIEYPAGICPVMCEHMTKGQVGDTSGDTVGCRITKAKLAEDDPVTYCQQAGPLGVDGCAEPCDSFCALVFATCIPSESVPFVSFPECQQECGQLEYLRLDEGGSDLTTTTGDNLNCWLYHLQVANDPNNPNAAMAHCNHIGPGGQCF